MEFRVLGPVGLVVDGDYVRLGGTKARTVLAALALRAGRVVSVARLIDAVWGEEPPPTAQALVQTQIAVLRKVLAGMESQGRGAGASIITRSPGYLLKVGDADVDLLVFEAHAARGRSAQGAGDLERAAARFAEALAVWSGPALGGVAASMAMTEAFALEQERGRVRKEWIEAELELGRHHALLPTLYGLVAESPVDESLRGRLMLALYRSGRADEALAVCRDGRRIRADELGMDPGPAMKALEHAILAEDPTLEPPRVESRSFEPPSPESPRSESLTMDPPASQGSFAAAAEVTVPSPVQPNTAPPPGQRAPHESETVPEPEPETETADPEATSPVQPPTPPAAASSVRPHQPIRPSQAIPLGDAIPGPRTGSPFTLPADLLAEHRPRWSRRRVMVAVLAVLTALTVAAPAAVTVRELFQPAAFATAAERAHTPSGGCVSRATDNDDLRNGVYLQTWHKVALCRNDVLAPLYLVPSTGVDSPVVGRLRTGSPDDLSWFLCWITGVPDHDAGSVYYYTTADDWAPGMEYRHGWGFVPAAYLAIGADHARSGLPECPPVPGW